MSYSSQGLCSLPTAGAIGPQFTIGLVPGDAASVATWSDAALTHGKAFRRLMISLNSVNEIDSNVTVISSRPFFLLQCTVAPPARAAERPSACQTETTLSWPVAARTVMLGDAGVSRILISTRH
jgi:hypothetical protein